MYILFTIFTAIAILSSLVLSEYFTVYNQCLFRVFVWTLGSSGSQNVLLDPYTQYREDLRRSSNGGVDIKFTLDPEGVLTSSPQLRFTYNKLGADIQYTLNNLYGEPFYNHPLTVNPLAGYGHFCRDIHWRRGTRPDGYTRKRNCRLLTAFHLHLCSLQSYDLLSDSHNSVRESRKSQPID
ncbi:hypothetical protein PMAA_102460 [Talaromyces marneffei ATCC 18224]|uniref:Uncharacterized protein n=1 Tax=Talaromyces marneffei (strain ATCC 18224 / CBS 334.59 / QM 7333) TaxID=441960 RepID=B6QWJ7_TALMQ|nr:hypothetical protein PMAA_102460 [Talaromyces marneffei ATCC 18224]